MDCNARRNAPSIMRLVSADDLIPEQSNPQAWNHYSYVLGYPILFTDPTGHVVCEDAWGDNCGPDPHALSTLAKASTENSSGGSLNDDLKTDDYSNEESDALEKDLSSQIPYIPQPLSDAERYGLVGTLILFEGAMFFAEGSLVIMGAAALGIGPAGVGLDLFIVVPLELVLIDLHIGGTRYIYEILASGTKEGHEIDFLYLDSTIEFFTGRE